MKSAAVCIHPLTRRYRRIVALLITFPALWACNARGARRARVGAGPVHHPGADEADLERWVLNLIEYGADFVDGGNGGLRGFV